MKVYLGLGSNLGDRRNYLEKAIDEITGFAKNLRISPIYETPALLPESAPQDWNHPYLNLVVEAETDLSPEEGHVLIQKVEEKLGRIRREKWSPRFIDVDILSWNNMRVELPTLKIPHPRIEERAFVLDPLKDLAPNFNVHPWTALEAARKHPQHSPLWMGVINIAPDSFSDGGTWKYPESLETLLNEWDKNSIPILDLGAESTRPGATPLSAKEEWTRLEPFLRYLKKRYSHQRLKPWISVDTRRASTAALAIETGADLINDVSGLADIEMAKIIAKSKAQYILMHSLSVPADPSQVLPNSINPIQELSNWFYSKIETLDRYGISNNRIFIDPGIGFGKSTLQSLEILRNLEKLAKLPFRLLVGHSRKSFLSPFCTLEPSQRDLESVAVSLNLAAKGADVLRVHNPLMHARAFRAWNHVNPSSL